MNIITDLPIELQQIINEYAQDTKMKDNLILELDEGIDCHDTDIQNVYDIEARENGKANMNPNWFSRIHEGHHGWFNVSKPTPHHHKEIMINELMFEMNYIRSSYEKNEDNFDENDYIYDWHNMQLIGCNYEYQME